MATTKVEVRIIFFDNENKSSVVIMRTPYVEEQLSKLKEELCKYIDLYDNPQALFEYLSQAK